MKHNFEQCLEWLLEHEGGYVDHPQDPGGATKYGVTIGTMRSLGMDIDGDGDVDKMDVRLLDHDDVAPVYKSKYWDKVRGDDLPSGVDWAVFDWAVNSGPSRAAKALQRAVGATRDGVIGPKTLALVASANLMEVVHHVYEERQRFYENLRGYPTFGRGWSRRNLETRDQALQLAASG